MHITQEEKATLQALAREYRSFSEDPVNEERKKRALRINGLTPDRPLIWIHEVPWNEINIDNQLTLRCTHPFAREMEGFFRRSLVQWKYFQGDMVLENCYPLYKAWDSTGFGLDSEEEIRVFDKENYIISHAYRDLLNTEEKVDALKIPVITAHPQLDQERVALAEEILNGILPVKLCGSYLYASLSHPRECCQDIPS